jgi:hypothetical protein
MAERKRRWVPIVLGVLFLLVCVAIGGMIVVASLFRQSVDSQPSNADEATAAFNEVRSRFGGRPPLLEFRNGEPHRLATIDKRSTVTLQHLKVLVWDPDDSHLTRVELPFWLVRLKSTPIDLGSYAAGIADGDGDDLRVEDLEAYGPGIVVEHTTREGERLLVWLE